MARSAPAGPLPPADAPADLLPAVQVRLEQLVRKLDLLERRVAHRERGLAELRGDTLPVAAAGETLAAEVERLADLDDRVGRLERRGFASKAGGASIDMARFDPQEARPGDTVRLTMALEGFEPGDKVEILITDIQSGEASEPLVVEVAEANPAGLSVGWKVPARTTAGAYRFIARGRGAESRSPVLTVRGSSRESASRPGG